MPRMSYACILIHTVLVCQNRRDWLTPGVQPRLHAFLGGIAKGLRVSLLAANGVADHSHLLLSISTASGMGEVMRELKTRSSRWMHDEMRLPQFGWQAEYAAFSVSPSARPRVEQYIANQAEHHRKFDLREEMLALLKAHGLAPNPRNLGWAQKTNRASERRSHGR